MKNIKYLPLLIVMFVVSCVAQKNAKEFEEINYSANTRGTNISIKVVADKLYYKYNSGEKTYDLSKEDKAKLIDLVNGLSLNSIADLKAPSEKRITDGALHGEFIIKYDGSEYRSNGFDAGNPPKELKPLEDLLYKLSDKK